MFIDIVSSANREPGLPQVLDCMGPEGTTAFFLLSRTRGTDILRLPGSEYHGRLVANRCVWVI